MQQKLKKSTGCIAVFDMNAECIVLWANKEKIVKVEVIFPKYIIAQKKKTIKSSSWNSWAHPSKIY